jgi:hypothetical protein
MLERLACRVAGRDMTRATGRTSRGQAAFVMVQPLWPMRVDRSKS